MAVGLPRIGGVPLVPWKRAAIVIADISNAGATGAAVLAAELPATARAALGLSDITNELTASMARASALCAFAKTPKVWSYDSVAKPGAIGSKWGVALLSGAPSTVTMVTTAGTIGGVVELNTTAAANQYVQLISLPNGLGLLGGALMPDLVAAASKWYTRHYFRLNSVPDATTEVIMGWTDSGGGTVLGFGVRGATDPATFRTFKNGAAGQSSGVAVDQAWHMVEQWGNGDTNVNAALDGALLTPAAGLAFGAIAAPFIAISNGATGAAQKLQLSTGFYITEGQL